MTAMVSLNQMLEDLKTSLENGDLGDWETGFVKSIKDKVELAGGFETLSVKQTDKLEEVWKRNYGSAR